MITAKSNLGVDFESVPSYLQQVDFIDKHLDDFKARYKQLEKGPLQKSVVKEESKTEDVSQKQTLQSKPGLRKLKAPPSSNLHMLRNLRNKLEATQPQDIREPDQTASLLDLDA